MRILNLVDEDGNIIGKDTRKNIHKKGLLHREVHVWFYTPRREIIFQLRGKDKDTFPNLLDATVGGHAEIGEDFLDAAVKEILEETGVKAEENDLHLVTKLRKRAKDPVANMINNVIRAIYAYRFGGKLSELRVEGEKAQGFEKWPIAKLVEGLSKEEEKRFIPTMLSEEYIDIYKKILKLLRK